VEKPSESIHDAAPPVAIVNAERIPSPGGAVVTLSSHVTDAVSE